MCGKHKRDVAQLIKVIEKAGWRVEQCKGSNHYKAFPPNGTEGFVTISSSPSCKHWRSNCIGDIRRIAKANGLTIDIR